MLSLEFDGQVVIHSCTKYLGGHSDILAGSVTCDSRALADLIWQTRKLVWIMQFFFIFDLRCCSLETNSGIIIVWRSAVSFRCLFAGPWHQNSPHAGRETERDRPLPRTLATKPPQGSRPLPICYHFISLTHPQIKIQYIALYCTHSLL